MSKSEKLTKEEIDSRIEVVCVLLLSLVILIIAISYNLLRYDHEIGIERFWWGINVILLYLFIWGYSILKRLKKRLPKN